MTSINHEASARHTEKALTILRELQADNENGGLHRDFMQTRLDGVEQRMALLNEELARCEAEKKEIKKFSHDIGKERLQTRNQLAQKAFKLLENEEGDITNRTLLWQTCAEQKLAHYDSPEAKQEYACLLGAIDTTLQAAHTRGTSHTLLIVKDDSRDRDTDYWREIHFYETDPTANGLVAFTTSSPTIKIREQTEAANYIAYANKSEVEVPKLGHINYHTADNQTITTRLVGADRTKTDIAMGAEPIKIYLDSCLRGAPALLQTLTQKLTRGLMKPGTGSLINIVMEHPIGELISQQATDDLIATLNRKNASLDSIIDSNRIAKNAKDRQRLEEAIDLLHDPERRQLLHTILQLS